MKTKTTIPLTLACLTAFLAVTLAQTPRFGPSSLPDGATMHRDLAYMPSGHERQKLDLYLPKDGTNLPLIINIHGGAFNMGSNEQGVPLAYLSQGSAVASINYRLSQANPITYVTPGDPPFSSVTATLTRWCHITRASCWKLR